MIANGSDRLFTPQVRELHIDFLLEEEFYASPSFLCSFISDAGFPDASACLEYVKRSVGDAFGEVDLLVVYKAVTGERTAVLIEDKLRAAFQPLQPERYSERGENGLGRDWEAYWTCLVAPEHYMPATHGFDAAIPVEAIIEMFVGMDQKRREFKIQVLREVIRKCESAGVQVVDPVMTEFRKRHYAFFHQAFAEELRVGRIDDIRRPAPTYKGDTWFGFRSRTHLPQGAYVNHKSSLGVVDLTFPYTAAAALTPLQHHLESDMSAVQTGKSAAIRVEVPRIVSFDDFDRERGAVEESFAAVRRLLDCYIRERVQFDSVLQSRG
jgi:hypothetical protein